MTPARTQPEHVDLALLRRFEPVLRQTQGEMFHPTAVEDYLRHAELVRDAGTSSARVLVARGGLDPDTLATRAREAAGALSLRYVMRPLTRPEVRQWRRSGGAPPFRPISRAAAVGLLSRLIAAVMQLTLLMRGTVPRGWTAAAAQQAGTAERRCTYYGRVVRDAGYVALQYWFLYPMNDWRSSFGGVNDHECDWEQVTVFATDEPDPQPEWVAFSSHDEVGADLRRRWDDPDLTLIGDHPVVNVGAGSHSGAYLPGEYLISVSPGLPRWIQSIRRSLGRILPWWDSSATGIGIPYVDYRRGDGLAIGPGQDEAWSAVLISDDTPWVRDYRGLWGLDTRDRFGGERAPAGPRYERDGRIRQSWGQPVCWADLDAVTPAGKADELWASRPAGLRRQLAGLEEGLAGARAELRQAAVADRGLGRVDGPGVVVAHERVAALRRHQAAVAAELDAVVRAGHRPLPAAGPHDHLRHRAVPLSAAIGATSRTMGAWAALSAGLLLCALGVVLVMDLPNLPAWTIGITAVMLALEALLRRSLLRLVLRVTLAAAAVTGFLWVVRLAVDNLKLAAGILLLLAALILMVRAAAEGMATDRSAGRQRRGGGDAGG